MYINPFLAGVLTTIFAEIIIFITIVIYAAFKSGKGNGNGK